MHHHHTDMFSGTEAGARFAEYAFAGGVTPSRPSPTPTGGTSRASKPSPTPTKPRPSKPAPSKPRPSKPEPSKPTAVEQAKEAIKDGRIASNEKSVVEKAPVRDAIKGERTRLQESVKKAEGAPEHWRGEDGKLTLGEDGKPLENGNAMFPDTEHEERVQSLVEKKDSHGVDALDKQIKSLEDAGVTTGLDELKSQRADRLAEEAKVVDVIEDKESLIGALEVEKAELEKAKPEGADDDYQEFREKAQEHLDRFNANGGQTHEADLFGDDWDNEDGDITFDQLAEDLADKDRLDDFANVQGKDDGDGGDSHEDMLKHINEVREDDPEEATRITLRYEAARELQSIFRDYNDAKSQTSDNSERIEQIDAEIGILNESIEEDRAALSAESIEKLDEGNKADTDIIEPTPVPTKPTPSSPTKPGPSNPNGGPDGPEGNGNGNGNGQGGPEGTEGNGNGNGQGGPEGTEGNGNGQGGPEGTEGGGTREVEIDYTQPEHRDRVLTQAQEQNLVPAQNTKFDDKGQAVYTVQPNDSYWRISDMSDGKPPHDFDRQHFATTVQVNSERFGRDPQVGLIHPDEQVVIPGRSIDELVALMGLPTTEQVPVEEEPQPRRGGPQPQ